MSARAEPIVRQWTHVARDGASLLARSWEPAEGGIRGSVLITHGMGEYSGRYNHVAERLTLAGLRVLTWDLRGHGRSDGARGDIRSYEMLVDDLRELWAIAGSGPGPIFLYGHSLGGQITLNFAVRDKPAAAGLVITSPWLRLAFAPPAWKVSLARVAARVWPSFTQDTEMDAARLSRDGEFLRAMPDLHLVHHRMSARMYHALMDGAERAFREGARLAYPMLLLHGAEDPVTCVDATKEFYHRSQSRNKALVIVQEALHETHNDLCRESVIEQITNWVEARLPAPRND